MVPVILAFGIMSLRSSPAHPKPIVERVKMTPWTLEISTDRQTGERNCRLDSGAIEISAGVVTFRLGARTDTNDAVYRVDGAPEVSISDHALAQDQQITALMARLPKRPKSLRMDAFNPSEGLVQLPLAVVGRASVVAIAQKPGAKFDRFHLDGLARALEGATGRGCRLDDVRS